MSDDYNELSEYTQIDNTELGEYCNLLLLISETGEGYGMSDEFRAAVTKEMKARLKGYKDHTRIIIIKEMVKNEFKQLEIEGVDY